MHVWRCDWKGGTLKVKCADGGFRFKRSLVFNKRVLDRVDQPHLPFRPCYLCKTIDHEGSKHEVEAMFGARPDKNLGCRILVDGVQVGGDDQVRGALGPLAWAPTHEKGKLAFLLPRVARQGTIAGLGMVGYAFFRGVEPAGAPLFFVWGFMFGTVRPVQQWESAERLYELRAYKLQHGRPPPTLSPGRNLASLIVISLGVLAIVLALLAILLTAFGEAQVDLVVLLVAIGLIALGLVVLVAGRRMRMISRK